MSLQIKVQPLPPKCCRCSKHEAEIVVVTLHRQQQHVCWRCYSVLLFRNVFA